MGELRLEIRPLRRADPALPEAHGRQALPVRRLLALLLPLGSPRPAHEEAPELAALSLLLFFFFFFYTRRHQTHTHTTSGGILTKKPPTCYTLPDTEQRPPADTSWRCRQSDGKQSGTFFWRFDSRKRSGWTEFLPARRLLVHTDLVSISVDKYNEEEKEKKKHMQLKKSSGFIPE